MSGGPVTSHSQNLERSDRPRQIHEVLPEAGAMTARTLPGLAGTVGTAVTGEVVMSFAIGAFTLIFLVLQIAHLISKWRRDAEEVDVPS